MITVRHEILAFRRQSLATTAVPGTTPKSL